MNEPRPTVARIRVWDLPTRLFHWALSAMVVFSFVTGKLGNEWLTWHFRSGYAIASLLVFRLMWGFAGPRYARFSSFVPSPSQVWRTFRSGHTEVAPASAGHSPIGTLSVYALLVVLAVQVLAGMFTNDGTFNEGPWARFVSGTVSDRWSTLHYYNHWLIVVLVTLHVIAIGYYLVARREDLITPMLTGDKLGISAPMAADDAPTRVRALILVVLAGGIVFYLVTL